MSINKTLTLSLIVFFLCLLNNTFAQQICLEQECKKQMANCGQECQLKLAECTFSCTMGSEGCMQDCVGNNIPAKALLYCSFDKCINL